MENTNKRKKNEKSNENRNNKLSTNHRKNSPYIRKKQPSSSHGHPPYTDELKKIHKLIRCTKVQFDFILEQISDHPMFHGQNSDKQFTVELQLALTLYRLGSDGDGATVQKISCLFGVGDGGTIDKVTRVFKAVLSLETKFLYWPTSDERISLVEKTMHELP